MATLVALRDAGLPLPAAGVLLSPWVDLEGIGESAKARADEDPVVERSGLLDMARHYLAGAGPRTPLAAPLYADLSGLPPLLIQVGTAEILLDDSTRLASLAQAAGVAVELEAWEDMIHVWQALAPLVPEATEAVRRIGDWLAIEHNRATIRQDEPVPGQQHPALPEPDIGFVLTDQARTLRDQKMPSGQAVIDILGNLRGHEAGLV